MTAGPAKSRGALEVILFEDTRFRGSMMFTSAEVTIGSDPGVMVRLDDPRVSPCHAALHFDGDACTIANYDAIEGTMLNGVSIAEEAVGPTDEIQVGRYRLRINVHRTDATPPPVAVRAPARPVAPQVAPTASAQGKVLPLPVPPVASPATVAPPAPAAAGKRPAVATQVPSAAPATSPSPPSPAARPAAPPVPASAPARPAPSAPAARSTAPVVPAARPAPPSAPASRPAPSVSPLPAATLSRPQASVASASMPSAGRTGSPPVALAVAPTVPAAKVEPVVAPPRPSLTSVPAETKPASARTATQPIASRYTESRIDAVPLAEVFEVTTERSAIAVSSPAIPVFSDDDEDDAFFEPTFSLFDRLREAGVEAHKASAVEVVRFRHGCILKLHHLRRGEKLRLHGLRKPLGRCSGAGGFLFHSDALPDSMAVSTRGQPVDDASWRKRADQRGRIALEPATQVVFPLPTGEGVLVHLVPAADALPRESWRPRLTKLMLVLGAVSVVVHLVVFAILGIASLVKRDYIADNKEGRFARIALKEIELEPPAPPPKSEKKKAKAEPSKTASSEPTTRTVAPHLPRTRMPQSAQTQSAATTQKLLSALGGLSAGPKPMSATAMSNLDAVGPVRGGGFKVSGAIGKLPGDSLRLAAAGSGIGRLDTKSANDVGKNLGRVLGHAPTGQVRAQVTAKPNLMKVEGHLDRGEIQKVINAHIHELQGCFERQLIMNPNLAGKVTFEWVIGLGGAVTVVKIKASTLSSNEATSCMQGAIRRWQFPAPSGGQVTVIYPVALASSGT
jgi:hypothetical protein